MTHIESRQAAEAVRPGGVLPAPVEPAECLGCEFIAFKPVTLNGRTVCATCPDLERT